MPSEPIRLAIWFVLVLIAIFVVYQIAMAIIANL